MKSTLLETGRSIGAVLAVMLLFMATLQSSVAIETDTNWSWLNLRLVIPETNLMVGDNISASIVVSNITKNEHILHCSADNPCSCGFGRFSIIESITGEKPECRFKSDGAILSNYLISLQSHEFRVFDFDLVAAYAITNAGIYSVSAVGWFPLSEQPTNNQHATMTTPPILIRLSPKTETNTLPK